MSYAVVRKMETDIELFLRQTFEPGYIPEMEQDGLGTAVDDAVVDMVREDAVLPVNVVVLPLHPSPFQHPCLPLDLDSRVRRYATKPFGSAARRNSLLAVADG